jgi:hypothetical protein
LERYFTFKNFPTEIDLSCFIARCDLWIVASYFGIAAMSNDNQGYSENNNDNLAKKLGSKDRRTSRNLDAE